MKIFSCQQCSYATDRLSNLNRHILRKHTGVVPDTVCDTVCRFCSKVLSTKYNCRRHESHCSERSQTPVTKEVKVALEEVKVAQEEVKVAPEEVKVAQEEVKVAGQDTPYKCDKCYKSFQNLRYLREHAHVCKSISHPLECHYCHMILPSKFAKCRHVKQCFPSEVQDTATQTAPNVTTINQHVQQVNIVNNHTQNNYQVNIQVLGFGNENLKHITGEVLDRRLCQFHGVGVMQLIKDVHFNDEYPENQNLRKGKNKKYLLICEQDGKWQNRLLHDSFVAIVAKYNDMLKRRYMEVRDRLTDEDKLLLWENLLKNDPEKNPNEFYKNKDRFCDELCKIDETLTKSEQNPMLHYNLNIE